MNALGTECGLLNDDERFVTGVAVKTQLTNTFPVASSSGSLTTIWQIAHPLLYRALNQFKSSRTAVISEKVQQLLLTSVIGVIAVVAFDGAAMCASDQRNT
jgi:glucose uptake protein GlcU